MDHRNLESMEDERLSAVQQLQQKYNQAAHAKAEKKRLERLAVLEEKIKHMGGDGHKLGGEPAGTGGQKFDGAVGGAYGNSGEWECALGDGQGGQRLGGRPCEISRLLRSEDENLSDRQKAINRLQREYQKGANAQTEKQKLIDEKKRQEKLAELQTAELDKKVESNGGYRLGGA